MQKIYWGQINLVRLQCKDRFAIIIISIVKRSHISRIIYRVKDLWINIYLIHTILTLNINIKSFTYLAITSGINKYNIMSSMVIATMNQNSMQCVIRTCCFFVLQVFAETNFFIKLEPLKINLHNYLYVKK